MNKEKRTNQKKQGKTRKIRKKGKNMEKQQEKKTGKIRKKEKG